MNSTVTETLNWQDIISGWTFSCGGEAPPEGLAESVVPAVSKSTDGLFEITTITFGFSGTAPYHRQKFTAEFSFSVSETANFYEIAVSSDDTASVRLGGSDFVSSELNRSGVASSAWSDTAGTLPEVSGTFETVGGPYSLSVTITLKRLVGAEWTVSTDWEESGPYEIKTATLSFSGNARSDTQGFSWNSPEINIDGGNWIEINVEADDEATVTAGAYSKNATLHSSVEFNSGWIENSPETLPLSVSYRNTGGPYRLSVTVTVKRSLRKLHLGFRYTPPNKITSIVSTENLPESEKNHPIDTRRKIGAGEELKLYVRSRKKQSDELEGLRSVEVYLESEDEQIREPGESSAILEGYYFREEGIAEITATFNDGEVLYQFVEVVYPKYQTGKEYPDSRTNSFEKETDDGKIQHALVGVSMWYTVSVYPQDVSFSGMLFWECVGENGLAWGIFDLKNFGSSHAPAVLPMCLLANEWYDHVGYGFFSEVKIKEFLKSDKFTKASIGSILGELTWVIPTRWTVLKEGETIDQVREIPNDLRAYLGEIPKSSIQTFVCKKIREYTDSESTPLNPEQYLSIEVSKDFNPSDKEN